MNEYIPYFDKEVKKLLESKKTRYPSRLYQAIEYALFGGKRIRPVLAFTVAEFVGTPKETVLPLALAVECIHSYSLIHDDLPAMDNDLLRRGKPTVHAAYGEATAILAGDALLNLAYEILFNAQKQYDVADSAALIAECAGAEGMVGGQAIEFETSSFDKETVLLLDAKKTGALFRAAVVGAAMTGGDMKKLTALESYAKYFGLAFQIADDIADADKHETTSYVTATSLEESKAMLLSLQKNAEKSLSPWKESEKLLSLFDSVVKSIR